jgi:hypothetical protein
MSPAAMVKSINMEVMVSMEIILLIINQALGIFIWPLHLVRPKIQKVYANDAVINPLRSLARTKFCDTMSKLMEGTQVTGLTISEATKCRKKTNITMPEQIN